MLVCVGRAKTAELPTHKPTRQRVTQTRTRAEIGGAGDGIYAVKLDPAQHPGGYPRRARRDDAATVVCHADFLQRFLHHVVRRNPESAAIDS
jgi:hypothetical protein